MKLLEKILLPKELENKFILEKLEERKTEWIAHFTENKNNIPERAKRKTFGEKIVLNGYQAPMELIDFPLKGKPCYLRIKRRRWKIKGHKESFQNTYKLHPKGLKCTIEFGDFLKGLSRRSRRKFFLTWKNLRHIGEKDFSMVSRIKRIFRRKTDTEA